MAIVYTKTDQGLTIATGTGAPVHTAVAGDKYTDTANGNTYQYTTSWQSVSYSASGLTYFTEAQNTTAPNATVPVDSLTAVTATTNGDIAIVPKGSGAILGNIPNNTLTGGNKRGANAVDLQTIRGNTLQVASGDWSFIGGGNSNTASGTYSAAFGAQTTASGNIGSFSAGWLNTASGGSSAALGFGNQASSTYAISLGSNNISSAGAAFSVNENNTASGARSFVSGYYSTASGELSTVMGYYCHSFGVKGRWVTGQGYAVLGDAQKSIFTLSKRTTDTTTTVLGIDNSTPSVTNQITLQNNNSIRFKGTIIARQSGSTNTSAWDIDGIIQRGVGAATTTLLISNVNVVLNLNLWGTPTLTANTTLGCLTVSVIGAVATNIQWTCVIDTTEVIYA